MIKLRPAQESIVAYKEGRMAVSAVPGSGKTFTLSLLASRLLGDGYASRNPYLNPQADQRVLIVTYLNSSVDTFRARIRQRLHELNLPADQGYDVRTLHSLALEILRISESGLGEGGADLTVADESRINLLISQALDNWMDRNPDTWQFFAPQGSPQEQTRWRDTVLHTARSFIRAAKNERYRAGDILNSLSIAGGERQPVFQPELDQVASSPLLFLLAGIYAVYQSLLEQQGLYDFDDLIWQATDLLENRPDLVAELRYRWPYVLEDEAQDSVPLQEVLLSTLTGPNGNWVRVGDPNQAITSTFTAAHPRFFNEFIESEGVRTLPLPNSGRSSPMILEAANRIVDWVIDKHPIDEVRKYAFRRQHILPTPSGDAQPNPPDSASDIRIRVYKHREEEEIPTVARLAADYANKHPEHTLAVLVPTHNIGYTVSEQLDILDAPYDNLLRGGMREREIASALNALLAILADPQDRKALVSALAGLHEIGHPAADFPSESLPKLSAILRSVRFPEAFLFPWNDQDFSAALPEGVVSEEEMGLLAQLAAFLRRIFALRTLPVDDLALALGDELFSRDDAREADLAIAYQLAIILRYWHEMNPEWRLPELSAELGELALGRRSLPLARPSDYGYEPQNGRITLSTQHSAKGLEWDAVFLVGIDGVWIPGDLDAHFLGIDGSFGVDLDAEALAQLRLLLDGDHRLYAGLNPTESAHVDVICERLRLFYVGITRARRYLHISRSRAKGTVQPVPISEPATVLGVLYDYLQELKAQQA